MAAILTQGGLTVGTLSGISSLSRHGPLHSFPLVWEVLVGALLVILLVALSHSC